jgi:hypothetical protein
MVFSSFTVLIIKLITFLSKENYLCTFNGGTKGWFSFKEEWLVALVVLIE